MKASIKTLAAVLLALSTSATAATPEINFTVEAEIPDNAFYAVGTGWEVMPVRLNWNESALSLTPRSDLQVKMKNSAGGIKAYLTDSVRISDLTGAGNINLDLAVAGKTLGVGPSSAVDIYTSAEAATEKTAAIRITQADTFTQATRPPAGSYSGQVTMVFDTIAATAP